MVVSEMGEQWSPNRPPETTAPIARVRGIPIALAMGRAMGIPRAQTPQELPVAKDTTTPIRNRMAGISAAGIESCTTPVRNWPIFMDLVRPLMLHAHTRIIMTCIMLAAPFVHLSMAPPRVMSFDLMPTIPAAMEPVRKHMAMAIWILAWPKQPMKPLTQIWPV